MPPDQIVPPSAAAGPVTGRRAFLVGALASAGLALVDPRGMAAARRAAAALPAGDLFPLGVASGDPSASGVVLWTRLVVGGLPSEDVAVDWEVAADDGFAEVVASGTAPAVAALAHSVHVTVDGLDPDRWYWYRFRVDGRTSPTGRTRTFPGRGVRAPRASFAVASCQNWSDGYYTAHAAIAADDIDFVVFLGDYIYESSANRPPRPLSLPASVDVPTYRARYELYKSDPDLQAAHASVPWIITMDDHEVVNNMLGDLGRDGGATTPAEQEAFLRRRADAFQVWYEHLPVRLDPPAGSSYRLHRTVEHSDLLRFHVLDGRQYRSPYPGGDAQGVEDPARFDEDRTMLGAEQEAWLDGELGGDQALWNVVAQQTVMTDMPITVGDVKVWNFDQWDGYPAARGRLLRSFVDRSVRNPMVLTGDIHMAAMAGIRLDVEDPDATDVAHEVVCNSISSRFDPTFLLLVDASVAAAPWVRYANARQRGYARVTVTEESWTTDFVVIDEKVPQSTPTVDHSDVVASRAEWPPLTGEQTTTTTSAPTTVTTDPSSPVAPIDAGQDPVPTAPGAEARRGAATYTG